MILTQEKVEELGLDKGDVILPNNITEIGDEAFWGCGSLTSIEIPESVKAIGEWAFQGCASLVEITLPDSLQEIGNGAFANTNLQRIHINPNHPLFCYENNMLYTRKDKKLIRATNIEDTFSIADGIATIGDYAFKDCESLQSIIIPNSVTQIGEWAFDGCESLQA